MELRVLQYFLAVSREQSISGAARVLHLTQPTLSRQLKELEQELNKQLLIRGNRTVTLTEEGMLLRKRAEAILHLAEKTRTEIRLSDETVRGRVSIGAGETDGVRLIARSAVRLRKIWPQVYVDVISGDAGDVCERLDKGLLDFGILLGDIDRTKYRYMTLPAKDVWGILMRRDCALALKESVRPCDLWDLPLILSRQAERESSLYRWLQKEPAELNVVATYNLIYNASLMVDEGLGYAFALDKLINTTASRLCFCPLEPRLELTMSLVWKKDQVFSRAAEAFLHAVQQEQASELPVAD